MRGSLLHVASLSLALSLPRLAAGAEWKVVSLQPDGLVVEAREVPESPMPELRLRARARASPAALVESAWALRDDGMQLKYLVSRRVLAETAAERTLFLEYDPPIIDRRQCVLRQSRWADAVTGAWHLRFRALRFAPPEGAATFAHLRGEWAFEPDGLGATRVVYVVLIDVGGVPAFLARGAQQEAAAATVREVIERAATPGPTAPPPSAEAE